MIGYCDRIKSYLERYHHDPSAFQSDHLFQDACCMCIVQIGELAGQLSEDARGADPAIPWRVIKDTRNFYVHSYGSIDTAAVWDTLLEDIPALRASCNTLLQQHLCNNKE